MNCSKISALAAMLFCCVAADGQNILTYNAFLENVRKSNVDYIAEKYNVDIARAQLQAAKVMNDPELSLDYANNQDWNLRMGQSFDAGLSYTFELGGKRGARIGVARSQAELTDALLEDFFRKLRADATISYLEALKQQQLGAVMASSYRQMADLARADSLRYALGKIPTVDARQSRLEAGTMRNDVLQSQADLRNALVKLSLLQGDKQLVAADSVGGRLEYRKQVFDLNRLIDNALNNRADLQAALKSQDVSDKNLALAKANRVMDLGLSVGVTRSLEVRNEIAPAPAFTGIGAGITIPLKWSAFNKGELHAAQYAQQQSAADYESVRMQVRSDVVQAYNNYEAASRQVEQFDGGLMDDARSILDSKIYSYQRGETSLLEVLNARRTYNDVSQNYIEALFNWAAARVELERAAGIWDISE